ncbi:G-protein coupled receptor Mth2-like [Anoplophora glabripennis]|uniref:G-protein coupled receptor Mth2-like n=1 Tax=Anoplophora glabripennis TaxID=217634 RepID=UPI0008756944|nr:G-protein coupled receptor Mth2-like [Anoplophora glabripennis]
MYLFAIALLIMVVSHGSCYYSKCCKIEEHLVERNSSHTCVEDKLRRMYVLTNETDYLKDSFDGECVDTKTDFSTFKVTGGKVVEKGPMNENIFSKCCPLNYTYNSVLHSCEESEADFNFMEGPFVKIGLPGCKVIVDQELTDITQKYHDLKHSASPESYCFDRNEKGSFVYRQCKKDLEVCENIRCIKKCCPDGQSFINRSQCFDTYTHGLNLSTFLNVDKAEEPFAVISNRICPSIFIMREGQYTFHLDDKGILTFWQKKTKSFIPFNVSDMNSYCIEHTRTPTFDGYLFFMCFPEEPAAKKFEYTVWAKILSCIFLVLTILVYAILHETRNVFGKLLVNYCAAIFFNDAVLTYGQLSLFPSHSNCLVRAFSLIFLTSASFSWSNVICCDIYRTFGSMQQTKGPLRNKLKKLFLYLLYGWGVPTVMTLIIALFYNYRVLPYSIQPYMAEIKCFFDRKEENYSQALFFNLPHLIIQLVNTVFFIKTTIYCLKVKNEINRIKDTVSDERNKRFQKDKERLFLILKLSVIMGISFMFEVISSFFDMKKMGTTAIYIEIVWDLLNCLQGVFIFIIFICKRKIYHDLLRKLKISTSRNLSFSSVSTQVTAASSRSSKKSSNAESTTNMLKT